MPFRALPSLCLSLLAILPISGCKQRQPEYAVGVAASLDAKPENSPEPKASPSSVAAPLRPSGPIRFTDVTAIAGIHFRHHSGAFGKKYLPETMGSGVCVIDYDNDGWQDILFVNSMDWPERKSERSTAALYHNNRDGTFTDVTRTSGLGLETYGLGCAVGDFDNDGFDDIYLTALNGNHLFRNLGNGKFVDVAAKAGVSNPGFSTGVVWFDYDKDGKLDLFVSHYVDWSVSTDQTCSLDGKSKSYCTPEAYKGESSALFHNLGGGRFEDVTKKAGLFDPSSKSLGVTLLDYDGDGWLDLFVANDTQPNKLYRNNHDGTFTESAFAAGIAFSEAGKARAGMGADAIDYDGSGRPSLVIGNFTNESISLYHNDGSGLFTDKAMSSGVGPASATSLTFSTLFLDYDLDGLPDIFAANGHVADDVSVAQPTVKYAEQPLLFHNRGSGKFEDVSAKVGAAFRQSIVGRGAAYLDLDRDGDLDLLITTSNGPAKLLRNDNGNANDMLRIKAVGIKSNRDAIGTKMTIRMQNGVHLSQMVKTGSSYLSGSELPLTFGLGRPQDGKLVGLEVFWPSGRKEAFTGIKANQFLTLQEGKGIISADPIVFSPTRADLKPR